MSTPDKHSAFCTEVNRIRAIKEQFKGDADFIETAIVKGWTLEQARLQREAETHGKAGGS